MSPQVGRADRAEADGQEEDDRLADRLVGGDRAEQFGERGVGAGEERDEHHQEGGGHQDGAGQAWGAAAFDASGDPRQGADRGDRDGPGAGDEAAGGPPSGDREGAGGAAGEDAEREEPAGGGERADGEQGGGEDGPA